MRPGRSRMTVTPPWPHPLLEDTVLVLAGAGPGLGAQIARDAAAAGAKVVLAARTEAYLEQLAAELIESRRRRCLPGVRRDRLG